MSEGLGFTGVWPLDVFPGVRAIKQKDLDVANGLRTEVPGVDSCPSLGANLLLLPLHDATASLAPDEVLRPSSPVVSVNCTVWCVQCYFGVLVVGPENAIAAAHGAIAVGE